MPWIHMLVLYTQRKLPSLVVETRILGELASGFAMVTMS